MNTANNRSAEEWPKEPAAEQQLDLFHDQNPRITPPARSSDTEPAIDPTLLCDADLIAGLSDANIRHCIEIVEEIGRRRLSDGIQALETLCARHAGFGARRIVPEQAAAIEALVAIGGGEAAGAVTRLVARRVPEGPGLAVIFKAAIRLGAILPEETVIGYLRHDDRDVRALAACCVRIWPRSVPTLIELLQDLHGDVRLAAAGALGRMGRTEARAILLHALRVEPSQEIVHAVAGIGDEECVILLGRTAVTRPDLAQTILGALEEIDHPRAPKVAAGLRGATFAETTPRLDAAGL